MIVLAGASGGIGKEILAPLASLDTVVGLYHKNRPDVPAGVKVELAQVDLSDAESIRAFASSWASKLTHLTVVNLAGLKIDGLVSGYAGADWDRVMNLNVKANFLLAQALLPVMLREQWGRFIHFSSRGGEDGHVGTAAYSTSKMALHGLSRVMAKEYARFGVTSNVLVLGHFDTGMYRALAPDVKQALIDEIPSKKLGAVSHIVDGIEFLRKSETVNGSAINIDGGI